MGRPKRIIIATICGIACGFICIGLASSGPGELARPVAYQILAARTMIGLAIGISAIAALHWALHGALLGLLFGLPTAFGSLLAPENPQFSKAGMFIASLVMGIIYGVLIELVTSVIFKARIKPRQIFGAAAEERKEPAEVGS